MSKLKPKPPPLTPNLKRQIEEILHYAREELVAGLRASIENSRYPTINKEIERMAQQARCIMAIVKSAANSQARDPIPVVAGEGSWEEEVGRWDAERRVAGDVEFLGRGKGK